MRAGALALLLLISPVALARAGASAPDILFTANDDRGAGIFVSAQDGTNRIDLTGGVGLASSPSWSPDGSQVVFATNRDTGGTGMNEIYVVNADGSGLRRLTFDATASTGAKGEPVWSPDGTQIAYLANGNEIWVVDPAGGTPKRLAALGGAASDLSWSTDGQLAAVAQQSDAAHIDVVDAASGAIMDLGVGTLPTWNPSGNGWIAYVDARGRVSLASAVGDFAPHELTDLPSTSPAWSPDAEHVVFVGETILDSLPVTRYGHPARNDLFEVSADGPAAPVRITGPFDPLAYDFPFPMQPGFSPAGDELSFRAAGQVWAANADGTCARPIPGFAGIEQGPYWRPNAAGSPIDCVDLQVHATALKSPVGFGESTQARVEVENHGNLTAQHVVLHTQPAERSTILTTCTPTCDVGDIAPGGSESVTVTFSSVAAGLATVQYSASANEGDITPADTSGAFSANVLACDVVGTAGADRIVGTPSGDSICGLGGNDWISGGRGDDHLDGGAGNDTIYGGPGNDTIFGRDGRDTIFARDGKRDWIDCGRGYDVVVADKLDHVSHCERVLRK
jgi:Tol biopolymer transport system component